MATRQRYVVGESDSGESESSTDIGVAATASASPAVLLQALREQHRGTSGDAAGRSSNISSLSAIVNGPASSYKTPPQARAQSSRPSTDVRWQPIARSTERSGTERSGTERRRAKHSASVARALHGDSSLSPSRITVLPDSHDESSRIESPGDFMDKAASSHAYSLEDAAQEAAPAAGNATNNTTALTAEDSVFLRSTMESLGQRLQRIERRLSRQMTRGVRKKPKGSQKKRRAESEDSSSFWGNRSGSNGSSRVGDSHEDVDASDLESFEFRGERE